MCEFAYFVLIFPLSDVFCERCYAFDLKWDKVLTRTSAQEGNLSFKMQSWTFCKFSTNSPTQTSCRCCNPFCRSVYQLQKCVPAFPPSHTLPGCTSSTSSQIKDTRPGTIYLSLNGRLPSTLQIVYLWIFAYYLSIRQLNYGGDQ